MAQSERDATFGMLGEYRFLGDFLGLLTRVLRRDMTVRAGQGKAPKASNMGNRPSGPRMAFVLYNAI